MTLPVSGPISLEDVNVELGLSATAQINMGSSAVRTLFEVASGAISMSDGYGKSDTQYYAATGGTITTDGDFKVHTFNSSGTFNISNKGDAALEYLVIAGGGSGGFSGNGGSQVGAGGFTHGAGR